MTVMMRTKKRIWWMMTTDNCNDNDEQYDSEDGQSTSTDICTNPR